MTFRLARKRDRKALRSAIGWQMFKTYLDVHHSCEDDLLWPVMEQELADRPDDLALMAALEAEHSTMDPLLSAIDAAVADRDSGSEPLGALTDALTTALTGHLPEPLRLAYRDQWRPAYADFDRWGATAEQPGS